MHAPAWLVRWLAGAAALVRAFAGLLERAASGGAAPEAAMQALAARFPGAPDHWLRVIAERAPHLAEGPPQDLHDVRGPPPPPLRPMAPQRRSWPSRRWAADDEPAAGPRSDADPGEPSAPGRRAGAVFRTLARRRRPPSGPGEPRRRAPGWSATFEPATRAAAEQTPLDTAPSVLPRPSISQTQAEAPSARLPEGWTRALRTGSGRARPLATVLPSPSMGDGPGMGVWAQRSLRDAGGASSGFPSSPERAPPSPALPPSRGKGETGAQSRPQRLDLSSQARQPDRAASGPAFDPPPRRRRTDEPRAPTPHAWPTLPPAAAQEIEEADAASPRLSDLAFEQERGLWSG